MMEHPKYKKGFKFVHVWNVIDFEWLKDNVPTATNVNRWQNIVIETPQSDNPEPEFSTSHGIPSFAIELNNNTSS